LPYATRFLSRCAPSTPAGARKNNTGHTRWKEMTVKRISIMMRRARDAYYYEPWEIVLLIPVGWLILKAAEWVNRI